MPMFKKTEEDNETKADKLEVTNEGTAMQDLYTNKVAGKKTTGQVMHSSRVASANRILVRPMVTEKGTALNGLDKYLFAVDIKTNKVEVAKAVETLYGVKPTSVNIINMEGKFKNYGHRQGQRKDWKKAIVTLPKGKTIDVYEGV